MTVFKDFANIYEDFPLTASGSQYIVSHIKIHSFE